MINISLDQINNQFRHSTPDEIIDWSLKLSNRRIVTTSFGEYSSILLDTFSKKDPSMPVVWCDTGYNNYQTYEHAKQLISKLDLNIHIYTPRNTRGFIDVTLGMPTIDDPNHEAFTELVKLEPFRRALQEHRPEVWFTNIRVRQTALRASKDIFSYSPEGILKISPFYYWTDEDLNDYLEQKALPRNKDYFDPVKVLKSRECGIQMLG